MKRLMAGGILAAALCIANSAYAHHSAAGIDRTKSVTVEGTIKTFKWQNPHSYIELEVTNAKGAVEIWNLEMTSPTFLVRAGWKSTILKAGDKVKATARPYKNGDPGGLFVSITLSNGTTLTEQAIQAPAAAPAPAR